MKKNYLIMIAAASMLLGSCADVKTTFYGQTFTYKNDVCYSIEYKGTRDKSLADVIKEQISAENIAWDYTGFVGVFSVTPFESHTSYDDMVKSMKSMATQTFDVAYKDFKLTVSDYATKTATINYAGSEKTYTVKGYNGDTEEDMTLDMYDTSSERVGEISTALLNGYGCHNGKWDCISIEYGGVINRTQCVVSFSNAVTWDGQETKSITWYVYAKINN